MPNTRIQPEYTDAEIMVRSVYMQLFRVSLDNSPYLQSVLDPDIFRQLMTIGHVDSDGYYCWLTDEGIAHWRKLAKIKGNPRYININ